MKGQERYWDNKIKIWSNSSYRKKGIRGNLIEWVAGFFRGPISARMNVALDIVGSKAKGKIIADLGCGVGEFCFKILSHHPKKVIGIDISGVAVQEARRRAKEKKVDVKVRFMQRDVAESNEFPEFNIAVGLGFIDYLDKEELKNLFTKLKGRFFFFSFPEKKISLINILHAIYLKLQHCPGAYKYERKELDEIIPSKENPRFIVKNGMLFVTNLPN